jgi:D-tyrosyl-tRNA(Tyr) deacylase
MRALVQRVRLAKVTITGEVISEIGHGLLVLLGVAKTDTAADADYLAGKVRACAFSAIEHGKMNRSVTVIAGEALVVSQFTCMVTRGAGIRPFRPGRLPAERKRSTAIMETLAGFSVPVKGRCFRRGHADHARERRSVTLSWKVR